MRKVNEILLKFKKIIEEQIFKMFIKFGETYSKISDN